MAQRRERWRKVRGWPHRVSDRGRVRSLPRTLADGRQHAGGLLAQTPDKDGYFTVHLRDGDRERTVPVHVLVAEAFPCWDGLEVRHLEGGQRDNSWTNLRWGTHRENEHDKKGMEGKEGTAEIGTGSRPFPVVTPISGGAGGASWAR